MADAFKRVSDKTNEARRQLLEDRKASLAAKEKSGSYTAAALDAERASNAELEKAVAEHDAQVAEKQNALAEYEKKRASKTLVAPY